MYQACLIKLPETQVDSTQQVQMINCIMSDAAPDTATTKVFTNSLKVCLYLDYIRKIYSVKMNQISHLPVHEKAWYS